VSGKWRCSKDKTVTTIQLQSQVTLDALITGVEQLDMTDLERFANQVLTIRAKRRAPSLSPRESELLQAITAGLPDKVEQRFQHLTEKRRNGSISHEEYEDLLGLIHLIEQTDAQRMEQLAELAQIRNVSLRVLMNQLGIQRPDYA
jgi:hypothetical protein